MRELQNCIERAVILTEGDTIHARHLSLSFRDAGRLDRADESPWAQIDLSGTLADATQRVVGEVERRKIEQALKEAGGNRPGRRCPAGRIQGLHREAPGIRSRRYFRPPFHPAAPPRTSGA